MSMSESVVSGAQVERLLPAPDDLDAQIDWLHQQGWTDGLPVVPPHT